MYVIKKSIPVRAFPLGCGSSLEQVLLADGYLRKRDDGTWEVKTRETKGEGEIAGTGDYIKLDTTGMPYPTARQWFEENHAHIEADYYCQRVTPRLAWCCSEPVCEELRFLLQRRQLTWTPENREAAFSAYLWGAQQTADFEAVIIFDHLCRDAQGMLTEVEFHFVAKEEFDRTYQILDGPHMHKDE